MNKVTLNGKIPPKRVNLKSVDTSIFKEDILQINLKEYFLKYRDIHYIIGADNYLYKFKIGGDLTKVSTLNMNKYIKTFAIINENALYVAKTNYIFDIDSDNVEIYKIENGNNTLIKNVNALSDLGMRHILNTFNFKNDIYMVTRDSSDKVHIFKSTNFGKSFTNITKQITISGNIELIDLASTDFIYKNVLLTRRSGYIAYFDGKTCKKLQNIDWDINSVSFVSEGKQCDDAPIFLAQINREDLSTGKSIFTYSFWELFESTDGINIKKTNTTFKIDRYLNGFLENEKTILYQFVDRGNDFIEFPVSAYIEE